MKLKDHKKRGFEPGSQRKVLALRRAAGRPLQREIRPEHPDAASDALAVPRHAVPSRRARLPELAPADEPSSSAQPHFVGVEIDSKAIRHEETHFSARAESRDETARLTVYVLNAILMVMAFPVGFGMLVFNILGGENLRTTAHMIALTGLAIALTGGAAGSEFLFAS